LEEIPETDVRNGSVLVDSIAVGVCGTDAALVEGKYGLMPWWISVREFSR